MDFDRFINFKTNWKTYTGDAVLLFILGWCILSFANFLSEQKIFPIPKYVTDSPDLVVITAFFVTLVLLFAIVKVFLNWLLIRVKKDKVYMFSSQDWPRKWIFNGKTASESVSDLKIQFS